MKRMLIIALAALFAATGLQAQDLVILHTNDTHSQIEPIRVGRNKGLGGVERRLQYIDQVREKYGKRKVLLLDAGDFNQGTPYYTVAHGDLEVELVNMMRYDVMTLGNHEFDNGQEDLARRLRKCRHKVVTCNYDFTGTPLEGRVKPYVIVRRGGMKDIVPLVEYGIELGISAHHIMSRGLLAGMNVTGDSYQKGDIFTTEMMAAVATTNLAMDALQPYLAVEDERPLSGTAVIINFDQISHAQMYLIIDISVTKKN